MATKPKTKTAAPQSAPVERFDFLNPLDGKTYSLPPFDKTLVVDRISEFVDQLPPLPSMYDALASDNPSAYQDALNARREGVAWLQTMTVVKTLDAHLPDADDPAKAAIIANVNVGDFAFIYKVYTDWVKASGGKVENEQGEG